MSESQFIPAWAVALIALGTPISGVVLFVFGRGSKSGEDRATLTSHGQRLTALEVTQNSNVVTVSNHTQLLQLMANENEKRDRKMDEMKSGIDTLLERTKAK